MVTVTGRQGRSDASSSGRAGELGGRVVVVAEHPGDHRSRGLEEEVADRRGASPAGSGRPGDGVGVPEFPGSWAVQPGGPGRAMTDAVAAASDTGGCVQDPVAELFRLGSTSLHFSIHRTRDSRWIQAKHTPGRRAKVAFTPKCEAGLAKLSVSDLVCLDRAIVTVSMDVHRSRAAHPRGPACRCGSTPRAPPA